MIESSIKLLFIDESIFYAGHESICDLSSLTQCPRDGIMDKADINMNSFTFKTDFLSIAGKSLIDLKHNENFIFKLWSYASSINFKV